MTATKDPESEVETEFAKRGRAAREQGSSQRVSWISECLVLRFVDPTNLVVFS